MIVDATACLIWLLRADGTEAAVQNGNRLVLRLDAFRDLVGLRVWTPEIPDLKNYTNRQAAVWFAEISGTGPDEHGAQTLRSFEITSLGGRDSGSATGHLRPRLAEAVARSVASVLSVATNIITPSGIIVDCQPSSTFEYIRDDDTGWPAWKQIWNINFG